jgi:hypothetical protein
MFVWNRRFHERSREVLTSQGSFGKTSCLPSWVPVLHPAAHEPSDVMAKHRVYPQTLKTKQRYGNVGKRARLSTRSDGFRKESGTP